MDIESMLWVGGLAVGGVVTFWFMRDPVRQSKERVAEVEHLLKLAEEAHKAYQAADEELRSENTYLKEQIERLDQQVWDLKEDIFFLKHDLTDAHEALRKAKGDG